MIPKAISYLFLQLRKVNMSCTRNAFQRPATTRRGWLSLTCVAAFALISTTALNGCAPLQNLAPPSLNVFIPSHPPVVAPGPDTPPQAAVLAGAWEGVWSDGDPSALLVLGVDSDSARILLACNNYNDDMRLPWHQWAQAKLVPGSSPRLEWKTPKAQFSFELSPDGRQLMGISQEAPPSGRAKTITITMTRRKVQPLMVDRPEPPCACKIIGEELHRIEREQDPAARSTLTDALIKRAARTGTPLVEAGSKTDLACATFLYSGNIKAAALAGDMNGWNEQKDTMVRVAGTDLYFLSQEYPSDARLEYKLVVNGEMILDPLNSRTSVYGRGTNSEAPMPMFVTPREIEAEYSMNPAFEAFVVEEAVPAVDARYRVDLPRSSAPLAVSRQGPRRPCRWLSVTPRCLATVSPNRRQPTLYRCCNWQRRDPRTPFRFIWMWEVSRRISTAETFWIQPGGSRNICSVTSAACFTRK